MALPCQLKCTCIAHEDSPYIAYLQYFANLVQIDNDTGLMRDKMTKEKNLSGNMITFYTDN